eukprot:3470807-Amphidinium_carterae.2
MWSHDGQSTHLVVFFPTQASFNVLMVRALKNKTSSSTPVLCAHDCLCTRCCAPTPMYCHDVMAFGSVFKCNHRLHIKVLAAPADNAGKMLFETLVHLPP